jgi:RNA polymerase sigma-70 factor (ECF subfamily)
MRPQSDLAKEEKPLGEVSGALEPAAEKSVVASVAMLFEQHADAIYNYCRRYTGDAAAAEDLTQEVFVRAMRYGASFEGRSSPSTWLYAIASNLCKDHFGSGGRLQLVEDGVLVRLAGGREAVAERNMEQEELSERIRRALGQLTDGQREVLILSRYHGKTYSEISEITGQSVNAIKATVFRAVARLRTLLEEARPGGKER